MTEKLYYSDSFIGEFDAVVTSVADIGGQTAVTLDRTAFYPTGGGQNGDTGRIGDAEVTAAETVEGEIFHFVKGDCSLCPGEKVHCVLDFSLRLKKMQSHSGEHIVSGVAHNLFGCENVGFHMDDDLVMTVDFDKVLDRGSLSLIEREANRVIRSDAEIKCVIYPSADAVPFDYRSKKEIDGLLRIVTVAGCDSCACSAPHLKRTGEIGLVKILSGVSHRGGTRITVIAGEKAFEDYLYKHDAVSEIAALTKSPHGEVVNGVGMLLTKIDALKREKNAANRALAVSLASSCPAQGDNAVVLIPEADSAALRDAANTLHTRVPGFAVAVCGDDKSGYAYTAVCPDGTETLPGEIVTALNGRGGGRGGFSTGRFQSSFDAIKNLFDNCSFN